MAAFYTGSFFYNREEFVCSEEARKKEKKGAQEKAEHQEIAEEGLAGSKKFCHNRMAHKYRCGRSCA
jgi:hypothetical protein